MTSFLLLLFAAILVILAAGLADLARDSGDSEVVRRHAASFAFPVFQRRLATALS